MPEPTPKASGPTTSGPKISEAAWPDLAGRLVEDAGNRVHRLPIRVYYEDTDFSGVAYHGSYVRWCERGRSDFLRLAGNNHRRLLDGTGGGTGASEPAALMVRRLTLDYLAPARIDDVLEVTTRVRALTAATLILDQRVSRLDPAHPSPVELVRADVTVVLVTITGRVLRIGKVLGDLFKV
jgi:acyl-CoA thioester hydrolase